MTGLFRPSWVSLFAASDITNDRMYLLWLDFIDEPEVWAYDANGESRHTDLVTYLEAYIRSDISAAEKSWRA